MCRLKYLFLEVIRFLLSFEETLHIEQENLWSLMFETVSTENEKIKVLFFPLHILFQISLKQIEIHQGVRICKNSQEISHTLALRKQPNCNGISVRAPVSHTTNTLTTAYLKQEAQQLSNSLELCCIWHF